MIMHCSMGDIILSNYFFYNHFFGGPNLFTLSNLGVLKKLWYKKAFQLTRYIEMHKKLNDIIFVCRIFFLFLFSDCVCISIWHYWFQRDIQIHKSVQYGTKSFHIVCLSIKETRLDKIVIVKMRVNWSQRGVVD